MINEYILHLAIMIGIYIILAVSLNLALGYSGLLNLGHVAFFGIGAYTSALLVKSGFPFLLAFFIAGLFSSIFGYFLVFATKRLRGDYFALATLGFNFVIYSLMLNWQSLTHGPLGVAGIPKPVLLGIKISSNSAFLIFTAIISALSVFVIYSIVRSPFGRLLGAMRDDEIGLRVLGKNTFRLKYKAMMLSAFFAGISGSLFAHYITYIDPSSFYLSEIILILTIVIVGGLASVKGSIVSPLVILLIPEILRFIALPSSILGPMRQVVYALILLVILMFRPRGLFGRIDLE